MLAAARAPTSRLSGPTDVTPAPPLTARALKRLVEARVEQTRARLAAAGVDAEIHVAWTLDRRSIVVRCAVLPSAGATYSETWPPWASAASTRATRGTCSCPSRWHRRPPRAPRGRNPTDPSRAW
jgi:hypothetical protein